MPDALAVARRIGPELVGLRRRLHRIPEVGLHLPDTQAAVLEALAGRFVQREFEPGEVLAEEHRPEGTWLKARVYPELAAALADYVTNGSRV